MATRKLAIGILFGIFILTGLTWNIINISLIYFSFPVITEISSEIETIYHPTNLQFCVRYTDLISKSMIHKKSDNVQFNSDDDKIRYIQQVIKVNEIFQSTPGEGNFIQHCFFRHRNSFESFHYENEKCFHFFSVKRSVYTEYLCYEVSVKDENMNQTAITRHYSVSTIFKGIPTFMKLSPIMNNAKVTLIALSKPGSYPYSELSIAPQAPIIDRNVMLSPLKIETHLLPRPYKTACINYQKIGFETSDLCYSNCTYKWTMNKLGKLPYSVLLSDQKIDMNVLSYFDLVNSTIGLMVRKIQEKCNHECSMKDCTKETYVTKAMYTSNLERSWKISILVPGDPKVTVRTQAKLTLTEFIILLMSTISTWTSFSIWHLNPYKLNLYNLGKKTRRRASSFQTWRVSPSPRCGDQQNSISLASSHKLQSVSNPK